ncbi:MAG: retropepsin-like aspartic protease [Planctomycetota bacterium]|nr:retropepsin-like aspartic protease [Planctomycetota bacterium]
MSRQCLQCESFNDDDALHCDQCGASLDAPPRTPLRPRAAQFAQALAVGLLVGLAWWGIQQNRVGLSGAKTAPPGPAKSASSGTLSGEEEGRVESGDDFLLNDPDLLGSHSGATPGLLWGWVVVTDPTGLTLSRWPAVATSGGWLALPRVSLLGAETVRFRDGKLGQGEVSKGRFRRSDDLSLWQLDPIPVRSSSVPLARWDSQSPLLLLDSTGQQKEWEPAPGLIRNGNFLRGSIDHPEPAVLLQQGAIVGWIPGATLEGAWLWVGPDPDQLAPSATLKDFQAAEFDGGKIAAARALLDPQLDDLTALLRLDGAIGKPARLPTEEIPVPYRSKPLFEAARGRLLRGVNSEVPGAYFDAVGVDALLWLEGPELCSIWLSLALRDGRVDRLSRAVEAGDLLYRNRAEDPAWQRVFQLLPDLFVTGAESSRSDGLGTEAIDWIVVGRARFPADDALRLLDAERLLDAHELDSCEELLQIEVGRNDLKLLRQGLLARLKLERRVEGRVLIEFPIGSAVIEATAWVGGVPIAFIIDTGASATSIPSSALAALGIIVDQNTPRRRIRTASDEFEAPVVALPRVDLGGAVVTGMQATVLDLPGQPDTGLLGLDFLGRFRIDLDVDRGWLILEPR